MKAISGGLKKLTSKRKEASERLLALRRKRHERQAEREDTSRLTTIPAPSRGLAYALPTR